MNGEEAFERGEEFYERGEYSKAIECFENALNDENYDTPGDAWNNMGIAYWNLEKYEKAIDHYKKAISSDPAHSKTYHNLRALKKISEMKYKMPALLRYGLMVAIIFVIISAYWLFDGDKLSGTEFGALIVFFMSLLVVMILLPESKYFKVGPSGIEFSMDTIRQANKIQTDRA